MAGSGIFPRSIALGTSTVNVTVNAAEKREEKIGDDHLEEVEGRFHWMISDFSAIIYSNVICVSPEYRFVLCSWYLEMCLDTQPSGWMALRLCNKKIGSAEQPMTFAFGILEAYDVLFETSPVKFVFNKKSRKSEWQTFCKVEDLEARLSELMGENGLINLTCRVRRGDVPLEWEKLDKATEKSDLGLETLSANFKALFDKKSTCDVTIKVKNVEFRAHRAVLIARSRVFASMFEFETLEKETGEITIPDCDPESFGNFLYYLYTGKSQDMSFQIVLSLYITADKYSVDQLKAFCLEYMKHNLTVDILCDVVTFADLFEEGELMSSAQSFFNRNATAIFSTSEWETLMKQNSHLANMLLKKWYPR